jgi:hypothetical protein
MHSQQWAIQIFQHSYYLCICSNEAIATYSTLGECFVDIADGNLTLDNIVLLLVDVIGHNGNLRMPHKDYKRTLPYFHLVWDDETS